MKAFILAAGLGSRLRPLTETVPKPLLPVGHMPLIGYALKLCAHNDISDVIINTHHLGDVVKKALGDGSDWGVSITYSDEEEILGTGGGLKRMHQALQDETFVVLNSDTIIDLDLESALRSHRQAGALATMVLRSDPEQERYGQIEIDDQGAIRRILGQGPKVEGARAFMFTGVHIMEPRFLEYLPPEVSSCVVRYGYAKALSNAEKLQGYEHGGAWIDAGTPERYLAANLDAVSGAISLRFAEPLQGRDGAPDTRDPNVTVAPSANVAADVSLVAPASVGADATVEEGARLGPGCLVGHDAIVGANSELERTVVLPGVEVAAGTSYKGVVVGEEAILEVGKGSS